jgi:hypothetical protein
MSPRIPNDPSDASQLGEIDEQLEQTAGGDEVDPADVIGPPVRDDAEPTARPPPSATTEPAPGESGNI